MSPQVPFDEDPLKFDAFSFSKILEAMRLLRSTTAFTADLFCCPRHDMIIDVQDLNLDISLLPQSNSTPEYKSICPFSFDKSLAAKAKGRT